MTERTRHLEEHPGAGRLGRNVRHDEKSKAYAHRATAGAAGLHSVDWRRYVGPYDQQLGDCTIEDAAGRLCTAPYHHRFSSQRRMERWYSEETAADEFPGAWPPDDTGSAGIDAAKLMRAKGYISGWSNAFRLVDALSMLQHGPIGLGSLWLASMDHPDADGLVVASPGSEVRGGHQYEITGLLLEEDGNVQGTDLLLCWQSWGPSWPRQPWRGQPGRFAMDVDTFDTLRQQEGDVISYAAPVTD